MRKFKRIIHKQFGSVGNFFAIVILVAITVIFINSYVLPKRNPSDRLKEGSELSDNKSETSKLTDSSINSFENPATLCNIDEKCSADSIPYKVSSGEGVDKYPFICFNNKLLVHKNLTDTKVGRGANVVAVDGKTFQVKLVDTFDTYAADNFLLRLLKVTLNNGDILIVSSYDEMIHGMSEAALSLMENYGSQLIRSIKFRDAFVMIGQKGLARGKALEMHQSKKNQDYAPAAIISGCAKFPLGQLTALTFPSMEVNKAEKIAIGSTVKNCGLEDICKENEFAVHVYTGKDNNDEPKICVDGKYVIARGINDAGRGLNIVIVSNGKQIIRTAHFDTWQQDSTNLEIFLENLEENVIIIAVTFDEASTKLSQHSRNLFFDLGSATIQNLKYRDLWTLIGQKGINGFSPYEEISYAGTGNTYANPIDKKMCVPQTLRGVKIRPDPLPYRNDKRRDFCSRYDGYGDFCNDVNVDKSLVTVSLMNKTLEDNPIYSTPILVIAGISHNSLRMSLETLLMQPGINPQNVIVVVDEKFAEPLSLIELFGFRGEKTSSSSSYMEHYEKALKQVWELNPTKDQVIVIEEDLILSPDFLYTLALLYEPFRKDETIGAIQMWNPNSFDMINGSIELTYRVDQFYGLGYLLRRTFYEKSIKNSFKECCSKRVWDKWTFPEESSFLMPDVSRVFHRPMDGTRLNTRYLETLFNQKRKTSLNPFPFLSNVDTLRKNKYQSSLSNSVNSATLIKSVEKCSTIDLDMYHILQNQNTSTAFKIIYQQKSSDDYEYLLPILPCFGLFPYEPLGLYRGILRFSSNGFEIFLVGSKSPFYLST